MKKVMMFAMAAFLFSGAAFAQEGTGKAKKSGKTCGKKCGKDCCKDKKDGKTTSL